MRSGAAPPEAMAFFARHSADLLCIATLEGTFRWVSAAWAERGFDEQALLAGPFVQHVHPDDVDATIAEVGRLASGETRTQFVNRYRLANGDYVSLEWSGSVAPDGDIYCIARDITGRLERYRQQEGQLAQLALAEELSGVGSWRTDLRDHTHAWSPQMYRIHGRAMSQGAPTADDALGYYVPEERERIIEQFQRGMATGQSFAFECRIRRDNGAIRQVSGKAQPVFEDGGLVALTGVLRDVTDERALASRLRQAEKLASMGTMAAGMAHEINNPLSYVVLSSEMLQQDVREAVLDGTPLDPQPLVQLLDDVVDGVDRIRRIVAGLRTYSKAREPLLADIDLGDVVQAASRLCTNTLAHQGKVALEQQPALFVHADEGQLVQVLVNLLLNAGHAVADEPSRQGRISMRTTRVDDTWVEIVVADNGIGMDAATCQRAMEPFFTTRAAGRGTGLGLYLSKGILEACGGSMEVHSVLGEGTTVTLRLRAASGGVEETSLPPLGEAYTGPIGRVLVVDDQERVAAAIARSLRPHEVVVQTDPHRALSLLSDGAFDLVLCDLMMPVMRGQDLYERAPDAVKPRFCFLTGGTFTADAQAFADRMGERVLAKPPGSAVLLRLVARQLRAQRTG